MGWPFVREPDECNVWAGFFVRRVLWLVFWADHALARETAIGGLKAEGRKLSLSLLSALAREFPMTRNT
jgi:hypothetical protein